MDLAQFVTSLRIVEVLADFATTIRVRRRPAGEVETFTSADGDARLDAPMSTEDLAHILLRFEGGARGSIVVSQVSFGRKNSLWIELDGSAESAAWDSESNEELWLGHRDRPTEILRRDPALYADAARGEPADEPEYPTFRDGHVENVIGDALALSNSKQRWVEVPL